VGDSIHVTMTLRGQVTEHAVRIAMYFLDNLQYQACMAWNQWPPGFHLTRDTSAILKFRQGKLIATRSICLLKATGVRLGVINQKDYGLLDLFCIISRTQEQGGGLIYTEGARSHGKKDIKRA